jgi:Glycosyl transferase family 2
MGKPSISVIIPTRDRAHLLGQTLDSVQQQTWVDWEIIVVDDGSQDDTEALMQQRCQADRRIRYGAHPGAPIGGGACRNWGTRMARGQYVLFLDSDDCLAQTCLADRWNSLESSPELDFGVYPCILFQRRPGDLNLLWNADTGGDDLDRFLTLDIPWQTSSIFWRRSALIALGDWDERLPSWQDWEFHTRALLHNLKYQRFAQPDFFWRMPHGSSVGNDFYAFDHLQARTALLLRMEAELTALDQLSTDRRGQLAGLQFQLIDTWAYAGYGQMARKIWLSCRDRTLINAQQYRLGLVYIWATGLPGITRRIARRLLRESFKGCWPASLMPSWSKTFRRTPWLGEMPRYGDYALAPVVSGVDGRW